MSLLITNKKNIMKKQEPAILTAKTFFWRPSGNSTGRRQNEDNRIAEVASFFESIGMETELFPGGVTGRKGEIEATFTYSESCKNVYKHFHTTRNGKTSNIHALRKLY